MKGVQCYELFRGIALKNIYFLYFTTGVNVKCNGRKSTALLNKM